MSKRRLSHPRYRLLRTLGRGGMGTVHLAEDRLDGHVVALKTYPASTPVDVLRREFLSLRRLRHPSIARAYHFGVFDGDEPTPVYTMELLEGSPLDEHGGGPPLDVVDGLDLLVQATAALEHLHRHGLLHLDVKPANLMVLDSPARRGGRRQPVLVLIDFGLVQIQSDEWGATRGTVPYMAPELLRGEPADARSDLFSLGVTFYRTLTGRAPFAGHTLAELVKSHRAGPAPAEELPRPLERLLVRLLARDPENRFENAALLLEAVLAVRRELAPGRESFIPVAEDVDVVGRDEELSRITAWTRDPRRGALLTVVGAPGSGRTRILEEVQARLQVDGRDAFLIRQPDDGGLGLVRDVVVRVAVDSPPTRDEMERAPHVFGPGGLVPRARRRANGNGATAGTPQWSVSDTTGGDPALLATRQAAVWVADRIARRDLHLLIDDVESPSGAFLREIVSCLERQREEDRAEGRKRSGDGSAESIRDKSGKARGALIISAREGEWRVDGPAVRLAPLSRSAVERWAELHGSERFRSAASRRRLHTETRGVPLLIAWEIRRSDGPMAASRPRQRTRGRPAEDAAARMAREYAGLEKPARAIVDALALAQLPPDVERLVEATGLDRAEVVRETRLLEASGILASRRGRFSFAYVPFRDHVARSLPAARRREIHRRIGRSRARGARERVAHAFHLFEAGDNAAALRLARAVGDIEPLDPFRRSDLLVRVLESASSAPGLSGVDRLRLRETLADRLQERGQIREARDAWAALLRGGAARSAERIRVRRKLAHARYLLGERSTAERDLKRCLERIPASPASDERLAVLAELAIIAHYRQAPERARRWAREGIECWSGLSPERREATRQQAVHLHGILGQVYIRSMSLGDAIEVLEEGERLARKPGVNGAVLLNNLGLAYHLDCRFSKALATFRRARDTVTRLLDESARVSIVCNIAQIHAKLGEFTAARNALDDVAGAPVLRESGRLRLSVLYTRALIDSLEGDPGAPAWDVVEHTAQEAGDRFLLAFISIYRAEAAIQEGELVAAREFLDRAIAGSRHVGEAARDLLRAAAWSRLALVEASCGRPVEADVALERSANASLSPRDVLGAWNRIYRGLALRELDRMDDAVGELDQARRCFARTGVVPGLVEALLSLAETAVMRGDTKRVQSLGRDVARALARRRSTARAMRLSSVRLPLLEARLELLAAADRGGDDVSETLSRVEQLLARAESEPSWSRRPGRHPEIAACVRLALARLAGVPSAVAEASRRLETPGVGGEPAGVNAAMRRAGLARLGFPEGVASEPGLRDEQIAVIEALIDPRQPGAPRDALELLERMARALGASVATLVPVAAPGAGTPVSAEIISWPAGSLERPPTSAELSRLPPVSWACAWSDVPGRLASLLRRRPGRRTVQRASAPASLLSAPLRSAGRTIAWCLVVRSGSLDTARRGDLRFLQTAAGGLMALDRPAPRDQTVEIDPDAATAPLEETRTLEARGEHADEPTRQLDEAQRPPPEGALEEVIAESAEMARVVQMAQSVAPSDLAVLVTGESGTGKDAVARAIHRSSRRASGPLVVQNIGSIPPALFEADLFGHARGAFTGAETTRSGFLLQAQGGTFVLDDVGDADPVVQNKLLRVLETRRVRPVGGSELVALDVRFIATAQVDIASMVDSGDFRKDLFYRLAGTHIHVPPLRERAADVMPLFRRFLSKSFGFVPEIDRDVEALLLDHDWPGNVRELRSLVQRLGVSLEDRERLRRADVEAALGPRSASGPISPALFRRHKYEDILRELEVAYLRHLFETHSGDLDAMARALNTSTRSLYRRFERHGLRPRDLAAGLGAEPGDRPQGSGSTSR